jgi:hypothetical protein
MAVRSGSREMCEEMVRKHPEAVHGCDSENGATAVHWAALMGDADLVGWLAGQGARIDTVVEVSGMQPIHWAATRGHTEVVKLLLKLGADIDARDVKGTTSLVIASQYVCSGIPFPSCLQPGIIRQPGPRPCMARAASLTRPLAHHSARGPMPMSRTEQLPARR